MRLFDCRKITKESFDVEAGYQPMHSIFYVLDGGFSFTVHGERFEAHAGTAVLFPTDVYFERKMHMPTTFYYARFFAEEGESYACGILKCGNMARIRDDLELMERLSSLPIPGPSLAEQYLLDLFRILETEKLLLARTKDCVVETAIAYFRTALSSSISVSRVAKVCRTSVSSLSHRFRKEMGISPIAYLNSMRMVRAKELLLETDLPITAVAAACGFESPYYFSNAFLRETGMRPKEYRRRGTI